MTSDSKEPPSNVVDRTHPPISQMADPHGLIEAFKSMILPIARTYASTTHRSDVHRDPGLTEQQGIDVNHSSLAPEAQQLLSALEKFITAVVAGSQSVQRDIIKDGDGAERPTESVTLASDIHAISNTGHASGEAHEDESNVGIEHPLMLKLGLSQARDRVFNEMPIRLLAFNSDGSGIELIERSKILERISSKMIAEFYGKHESDTRYVWNRPVTESTPYFFASHAQYAILSHTWLHDKPGEVTYAHWMSGKFDMHSPGYQKLVNFCRVAATTHGVTFGWMDTVCINKESSAELDESIRSMYKWYKDASICIAYLAEATNLQDMHKDTWFTRGWTLQEMLAPRHIKFYGANWRETAGDHEDDVKNTLIQEQIQLATTITPLELELPKFSTMLRRMQWATNRHVTRAEDAAYSLMGIFDVNMSIAYGEGSERAFIRLVKEILMLPGTKILDILNWGSGSTQYENSQGPSLIPTSLQQYLYSVNAPIHWPTLRMPISLTNLGLRLPVLIMRANKSEETAPANPIGNYYATVTITATKHELMIISSPTSERQCRIHFNILDKANPAQKSSDGLVPFRGGKFHQKFFGVLNFDEDAENILLPTNNICFAVCLYSNGGFDIGNFHRIQTSEAITFRLRQVRKQNGPIRKRELARHGMQVVTMYL